MEVRLRLHLLQDMAWESSRRRGERVSRQVDPTASQREGRASVRAGPASQVGVEEDDDDRDVIVEVATDPAIDLLEVGVSHLPFLCCFLKRGFDEPPSTSLQEFTQIKLKCHQDSQNVIQRAL